MSNTIKSASIDPAASPFLLKFTGKLNRQSKKGMFSSSLSNHTKGNLTEQSRTLIL